MARLSELSPVSLVQDRWWFKRDLELLDLFAVDRAWDAELVGELCEAAGITIEMEIGVQTHRVLLSRQSSSLIERKP
jgi:hypothetical protein